MRRLIPLLLLVAALGLAPVAPPAHAGVAPVLGRIMMSGNAPTQGIELRAVTADGTAAGSTRVAADGTFALMPSIAAPQYYVEVVGDRVVQGGWVGPGHVVPRRGRAVPVAAGEDVGDIWALPSFVSGRLVRSDNGRPVRQRLPVRLVDARNRNLIDRTRTNLRGQFRFGGLDREDYGVYVVGGRRFESGYWGCRGVIVPTWQRACQVTLGDLGRIRIDRR